jgi:dihydrolipoamide dehydrogenase
VGDGVEYELDTPNGKETHRVERALISIGREPNLDDLGLEAVGVALDPRGGVLTSGVQTTVPNIYAAGDVTADVALVNVAELEARTSVEHMFGLNPPQIHYDALPSIMFLSPEVACVGLNEQQARARRVAYRAGIVQNRTNHRYIAMRDTGGFIKLLSARDGSRRILGLRVVGQAASSTAQGVALLIDQGATLDDIDRSIHPHPAVPEGVQECARLLLGRSILKLEVHGPELLRVHEG